MKPEWVKPDAVDSVKKFSKLSDNDLKDLVYRAFENEMRYHELKRLAIIEQGVRADKRIVFDCIKCGKKTNGYPGSPRVQLRKCRSCNNKEESKIEQKK